MRWQSLAIDGRGKSYLVAQDCIREERGVGMGERYQPRWQMPIIYGEFVIKVLRKGVCEVTIKTTGRL